MAINPPGEEVQGPACVPSRFGLFSVAEIEDRADGKWLMGFHHEELSCARVETRRLDCTPTNEPKTLDDDDRGVDFPESDPFVMIAPYECAVGGSLPLSTAWDRAGARLDQSEARDLERIFWTGRDEADNVVRGTLGGDDAVDITPGTEAVSITDGLALLESWAGENISCAPVIHAARGISTYMAERGLIAREGLNLYADGTGSRIAVGGGYLVSGPNNAAALDGEGWLFASGSIRILRGPKFFTPGAGEEAQAVDRQVNDITVYAERTYGIERACGLAAIRVKICSSTCC